MSWRGVAWRGEGGGHTVRQDPLNLIPKSEVPAHGRSTFAPQKSPLPPAWTATSCYVLVSPKPLTGHRTKRTLASNAPSPGDLKTRPKGLHIMNRRRTSSWASRWRWPNCLEYQAQRIPPPGNKKIYTNCRNRFCTENGVGCRPALPVARKYFLGRLIFFG